MGIRRPEPYIPIYNIIYFIILNDYLFQKMQFLGVTFIFLYLMHSNQLHPTARLQLRKTNGGLTNQKTQHIQKKQSISQSESSEQLDIVPQKFHSLYVKFASSPPTSPPLWYLASQTNNRRRRSNAEDGQTKYSVCETNQSWTTKSKAINSYGNQVGVVQHIMVGHTRVAQYFFEVRCVNESCACEGIDTNLYTSECETNNTFVRAKIINQYGVRGWGYIKIASSCGCKIRRKSTRNIYDSLWDDFK